MIPRYKLTLWGAASYRWVADRMFYTRRGALRAVRRYRVHGKDTFDYTITDTWTGRHEHA